MRNDWWARMGYSLKQWNVIPETSATAGKSAKSLSHFTNLGGFPNNLLFPSICICTLMRSVGLAKNWASTPEVTPLMADFLKCDTNTSHGTSVQHVSLPFHCWPCCTVQTFNSSNIASMVRCECIYGSKKFKTPLT